MSLINYLMISLLLLVVFIAVNITIKVFFLHLKKYNKDREENFKKHLESLKSDNENKINKSLLESNTKLINTNRLSLKEILDPFKEDLKELKKRNEVIHESQTKQVSELNGTLNYMRQAQAQLSAEANNLAKSLRGEIKLQGLWGEGILKKLLESSGLKKDVNYEEQPSYGKNDNKKIPDFVIHLPENKQIIIDAKLSLNSYVEYHNASNETQKKHFLESIRNDFKRHIDNLASKEYHNIENINTIKGVFLFVPLESVFFILIDNFKDLFLEATKKNIYITSSTLLLPLLQVIESMWKSHKQNKNALEMARIAGKIYDKCSSILLDFNKMQDCIDRADKHLNSIKEKLTKKDNLVRNAKKLQELGAKNTKNIPEGWETEYNEEELDQLTELEEIKEQQILFNKSTEKGE